MTIVRLARTATIITIAIVSGFLIGATIVSRAADSYGDEYPEGNSPNDRTYAVATSCERHGPVGIRGFGYWWTCQTDVHWQGNGEIAEKRTADFLKPDDIDKKVRVNGIRNNSGIKRAADQPYLPLSVFLMLPFSIVWIFGWVYIIGRTTSGPKRQKRRLTRGMEILNEHSAADKKP